MTTIKNKKALEIKKSKRRWSLLPWELMDEIVDILTIGAIKYSDEGWKKLNCEMYEDALMRHFSAYMKGEYKDKEDGYSHLSHVICNALFVRWFNER